MREAVGGRRHPSVLHAEFGREKGITSFSLEQNWQLIAKGFEMAPPQLPVTNAVKNTAQPHCIEQAKAFYPGIRGQAGADATHPAIHLVVHPVFYLVYRSVVRFLLVRHCSKALFRIHSRRFAANDAVDGLD